MILVASSVYLQFIKGFGLQFIMQYVSL